MNCATIYSMDNFPAGNPPSEGHPELRPAYHLFSARQWPCKMGTLFLDNYLMLKGSTSTFSAKNNGFGSKVTSNAAKTGKGE